MRQSVGRLGRWFSPTGLVLAGLCFALPFVTVACDTPGGYGRAAPGGTTTYTGFDLALGDEPTVSPPEKLRPLPAGQDDRLWPQPAAIAVLVLVIGGVAYAVTVRDARTRRAGVAVVGAVAMTALLVNQALVESELAVRVGEQLTGPPPAGKGVRDFVQTGAGFVACLLVLALVTAVNVIGWWRTRPRPALVASRSPSRD
ncbi:MAG TPA: hypothetical protein VK028_13235 [Micromonosporaceae bacterium]|nr:hypothetical protein [Micromonosporaceae bacterium]